MFDLPLFFSHQNDHLGENLQVFHFSKDYLHFNLQREMESMSPWENYFRHHQRCGRGWFGLVKLQMGNAILSIVVEARHRRGSQETRRRRYMNVQSITRPCKCRVEEEADTGAGYKQPER